MHIETSAIIAAAFALFALGALVGLGILLADALAPLFTRATDGMPLTERIDDVLSRWRGRRRKRDGDDDGDGDDDLQDSTAALLTMIPAAAVVVDDEDEVVRANPDAYRLGVVDDDAIVSVPIAEAVREVRAHGGRRTLELMTRTPRRFADIDYAADADDDDGLPRIRTVSRPNWLNVTVGRISEGLVVVLLDDVSESVRFAQVRDDFIANVSQRLVQPSDELKHLAETLERGGLDERQIARDARSVRRTIGYIDHMIGDLLLLIKAQEQVTPTVDNVLHVLAEVEAAVDVARPLAAEHGQRITVRGDDTLVVHGESAQIRAAIGKLLDNALRYSPGGATVSVDVRASRDGRDAVIRVIDRGIGIPEDEQQRIFERFYRGRGQNARTADGAGLGLAIVKHVALTHHGSVQVWSRPGQGSTFTLVLPMAKQE
ncbi:sensor histidine kinase [Bifidobacterium castoris]|uniref:Sensor-like histidine kinase SenX3 n=1 Tax=Bifidobacterium castoris TaxID=2306972 RepID=A0A430F4P4_9BIFI|nr:ATP-binding protein [Bifidobacterium castoris]RSX45148.1 ATPase [Bifidobacterium castoris]